MQKAITKVGFCSGQIFSAIASHFSDLATILGRRQGQRWPVRALQPASFPPLRLKAFSHVFFMCKQGADYFQKEYDRIDRIISSSAASIADESSLTYL